MASEVSSARDRSTSAGGRLPARRARRAARRAPRSTSSIARCSARDEALLHRVVEEAREPVVVAARR